MSRLTDSVTAFIAKRGEHYVPMLLNGGVWIGLAACTAGGLTIDKWIDLRNQAVASHLDFKLDWLDWTKAVFALGAACFVAYRNFTDGSWSRYRSTKKESETEFLRRQAQNSSHP